MRRVHLGWMAASGAAVVLFLCGFAQQPAARVDVPVIATAAARFDELAALRGEERFAGGARLVMIQHGAARGLVEGFAASADADVSFDAKHVLFAGKKTAESRWAIWELTLADGSVREVLGADADLVKPLYLPGERMVYARRTAHGFEMETAGLDGKAAAPLSFGNASAMPLDVLEDGRILFEAGYPLGTDGSPEMYLVYSDGSGVESYRCDHGKARWGGRQVASGDVVFTEGSQVARFTSAQAVEERVPAPAAEYAGGMAEVRDGVLLVSARAQGEKHYSLEEWKAGAETMRRFHALGGEDLVEPVVVRERARPRKHPSALHPWDYANLLALDARESREGDLKTAPARVRVEALDAAGKAVTLGEAPVERDGSFFVKAPGDRALRFALLDAKGNVVRAEKGWFWARGGEQRICVGCHTGPERAAENRLPEVLLREHDARGHDGERDGK